MSRFARGACGAIVADLDLVAVGPAVAHLVPCGFDVDPVGGVGASAAGCDDGCDDGVTMGTAVVIRASVC